MRRLEEILRYLAKFITEKLTCRVSLDIDFHEGNVRNCKKRIEDTFKFNE